MKNLFERGNNQKGGFSWLQTGIKMREPKKLVEGVVLEGTVYFLSYSDDLKTDAKDISERNIDRAAFWLMKKLKNKDHTFYLYLAGYSPYPESINFNRFMFNPSGSSRYKKHLA